jgi:hypothetical protein
MLYAAVNELNDMLNYVAHSHSQAFFGRELSLPEEAGHNEHGR